MKILNKESVQRLVLQNCEPLSLDKFSWDENTRTFSTKENNLFIDFTGINDCTFKTGYSCTFNTASNCTFDTGSKCAFKTGYSCTFKTGYSCTFNTASNCTFETSSNCNFKTYHGCIFETGYECNFNVDAGCTFKTGADCTFSMYDSGIILKTEKNCVYIMRDDEDMKIYKDSDIKKEVMNLLTIDKIILNEMNEFRILDNSLMVIIKNKVIDNYNIISGYYVEDYFYDRVCKVYIAEKEIDGKVYTAHGESVKKAIKDVNFKYMSQENVEDNVKRIKEKGMVTPEDYRLITGSCELGTRKFCEENKIDYDKDSMPIKDVLELTKNAYMGHKFAELMQGGNNVYKKNG